MHVAATNRKLCDRSNIANLCNLGFATFTVVHAGNTNDILNDKRLPVPFSNLQSAGSFRS